MSSDPPKQPGWRGWINPRTGRPWRLTDPEIKAELDAELKKWTKTPELARQYLIKHGFLTKTGKLPKKYGG